MRGWATRDMNQRQGEWGKAPKLRAPVLADPRNVKVHSGRGKRVGRWGAPGRPVPGSPVPGEAKRPSSVQESDRCPALLALCPIWGPRTPTWALDWCERGKEWGSPCCSGPDPQTDDRPWSFRLLVLALRKACSGYGLQCPASLPQDSRRPRWVPSWRLGTHQTQTEARDGAKEDARGMRKGMGRGPCQVGPHSLWPF